MNWRRRAGITPLWLLPLACAGCDGQSKDDGGHSGETDTADTAGEDSGESEESGEETETSSDSDSETGESGESGESDTHEESGGDTDTGEVDSGPVEGPWETVSIGQFGCVQNRAGGLRCFDDDIPDLEVGPPAWGPYLSFSVDVHLATCVVDEAGSAACYVEPTSENWCGLDAAAPDPVTTISAGSYGVCGLTPGGATVCWGCDPIVSDAPSGSGYQAISVGYSHACLIDALGEIECWGRDSGHEELIAPSGTYNVVSVGSASACAVSTDGGITCWGKVHDNLIDRPPLEPALKVSLYRDWACAILLDGELTCWGVGVDKSPTDWSSVTLPAGPFVDLSVGHIMACAVRVDGSLACFEENGDPYTDGVP